MRGIRIWHLAALALSVPLLAAAVPDGCTGGLNPNIRQVFGQDAGTGIGIPKGYLLVGIFNETSPSPGLVPGYNGQLSLAVQTSTTAQAWSIPFTGYKPESIAWSCDLLQLTVGGGNVFVTDPTTGAVQSQAITYDGPSLSGNGAGEALECGTVIKVTIVPDPAGGGYVANIDILK